tara:strand:- start:1651 stop:3006 length:1356 start_codon:yes stop_codon:yes gene_type:complete
MWFRDPRSLVFLAAGLDLVGQMILLALLAAATTWFPVPITAHMLVWPWGWTIFCLLLYPSLGWLFGSYTVLRWRHLPQLLLLQRVLLTCMATLVVLAIARWVTNPPESIWLLHRRVQLLWLSGVCLWSLLVRISLRRGLVLPDPPQLLLVADSQEAQVIQQAWSRVPQLQNLQLLESDQLQEHVEATNERCLITLGSQWRERTQHLWLSEQLDSLDPRQVQVISPAGLFERQQERLPPALLAKGWMTYDEMPWAAPLSFQTQLKRASDLVLASVLLMITSPLLLLAMAWIWLDDQGPVFYQQKRSGWMGDPFTVLKLRTMRVQPAHAAASWTQEGDQRITHAGKVLRRLRIDELPQLLNVLTGDMSLIGPRPERPELEDELEHNIPHYRMRHWMRPGLSGWAQVCAPYASSIEDSDLKLSYDLFYLKRFSTWLDLMILFRTIKTILKASGR